jgi:hypothetical protein
MLVNRQWMAVLGNKPVDRLPGAKKRKIVEE